MEKTHVINGVSFRWRPEWDYGYDIGAWLGRLNGPVPADCPSQEVWDRTCFKELLDNCLWAWGKFVLKLPFANNDFFRQACVDVQNAPLERALFKWARGHCKSTIVTAMRVMQVICKDPEITVCLFSYTKSAALKFFTQIRLVFEESGFLKWVYPDVLWSDPIRQAPKWSDDFGLFVRRKGFHKEPTLYASGLLEGMPTGGHFKLLLFDDVMVEDLVNSPEQVELLKERFAMCKNVSIGDGCWIWVVGTPYTPDDLIQLVSNQKRADGSALYFQSVKPATEDGTWNGKPVFMSQEFLDELKLHPKKFASQQLLNPTPEEVRKLNSKMIKYVEPWDIPKNLYRFMAIDPAGERKDREGDSWAMHLVGVAPYRDDLGLSDIYLIDSVVEELPFYDALKAVVDMYLRSGRVLQLGIEKVGQSTAEVHIANALRAHGKHLSIEAGNLVILRPGGRKKHERIESSLVWPLNNGKIHISTGIATSTRERLKLEMDRFPLWRDDGLDALSYVYDMLKDYRFGLKPSSGPEEKRDVPEWFKEWRGGGSRGGRGRKNCWVI